MDQIDNQNSSNDTHHPNHNVDMNTSIATHNDISVPNNDDVDNYNTTNVIPDQESNSIPYNNNSPSHNRPALISRHHSLPTGRTSSSSTNPNNTNMNNLHYQFLTSNSRSVSTSTSLPQNGTVAGATGGRGVGVVSSLSAALTLTDDLNRMHLSENSTGGTSLSVGGLSLGAGLGWGSFNSLNHHHNPFPSSPDALSDGNGSGMNLTRNISGGLSVGLTDSFRSTSSSSVAGHDHISASSATQYNPDVNHIINPQQHHSHSQQHDIQFNHSKNITHHQPHQKIKTPKRKTKHANTHQNNITSIIHDAARVTDWKSVNELAQTHPASAAYKCPDGLTPIHHACSRRCPNPYVFHNLIKANPNALTEIDDKGWTPLHYACRFKAPKEGVRLLLHLYKEKGCYAARLRCKEKGRTPLFYAIRYDAPEGVVELLLNCMTREDVLHGDRDGQSVLGLVWDQFVTSMEGQRVMKFYDKTLKKWREKNVPWEKRVEHGRKLREGMNGKLKDCWERANMLLRGAFQFPLRDDDLDASGSVSADTSSSSNIGTHQNTKQRKWRILHAAVSIRCHSTLALMACVLHPEQIREIDDEDLFGPNTNNNNNSTNATMSGRQQTTDKFTALHLASKSTMPYKDSRLVLSQILEMCPELASIPNPADNSYPLHYLCENTSKVHWAKDIRPVYNAFPQAALEQDLNGRTPLHRATTISELRDIPPPPPFGGSTFTPSVSTIRSTDSMTSTSSSRTHTSQLDPAGSIIQNILALHVEVASIHDVHGKLPFHSIAELGETWDTNVQCLYDAYPRALSSRTNGPSGSNLPIHLVASNPDAKPSLISKVVELNPRAASLVNREGKLPLHLACESGKSFEGGFECIYNAFPNAIHTAEDNEQGWLPLHFIVTCPNSSIEMIDRVMKLNPDAATRHDGSGKTLLHLAVESGKDWSGGIQQLFEANPDAIHVEDTSGRIPLVTALLTYCDGNDSNNAKELNNEANSSTNEELNSSINENLTQIESSEMDDNELIGSHLAQVDVLYHLLKAAPHVLDRSGI